MTEPGPEGLPPDIAQLLVHERGAPPAPEGARARVAARLGLPAAAVPPSRPGWLAGGAKVGVLALAVAGGAAWLATRPARVSVAPPAPVAVPATAQSPSPAPAPQPMRPAPAARTPAAETEIGLLRRARRALAAHDPVQALAALERHRRRWPEGELLQEREVLAIQALSLAGSPGAARERADAFLARFPSSTLSAAVRQLRAAAEEASAKN
jgi:hypothetical protein